HALHGRDRNRVEVHRRRAAAHAAVDVEQAGQVPALAVDQDQHLVRGQAAQLRRAHAAGAVGQGRAREVERGQGACERGGQLAGAGGLQRLGGDDVDRRLRLGHGAVGDARAGDDQGVQHRGAGGGGGGLLLGLRHGGGNQGGGHGGGEKVGLQGHGGYSLLRGTGKRASGGDRPVPGMLNRWDVKYSVT